MQHHLLQINQHSHGFDGVALLGSEKVFRSINALMTHLSIMKESLPCTLFMQYHSIDASDDSEDDDDIIDIDREPELQDIIRSLQNQLRGGMQNCNNFNSFSHY